MPNWEDEPKLSAIPKLVNDGKFFWHEIKSFIRDVDDDDPMSMISGFCEKCEISRSLDDADFPNHKDCANCSANYTLRAFGSDDPKDINMRIYLAHKAQMEYIDNPEWISYNVGNELMGFIGATIKRLINSDIGKAISQYGFVRMHPSAAAKMFASNRGHLIVTTRFDRALDSRRFFRFSYDMGNKLYAAYMHAMMSPEFIFEVFATSEPKEEKLGDAIELMLGLFDIWDSVPQCIPDNFEGPEIINEMRRGLENSLLYFCSVGSVKIGSQNRKANKRSKGIKEAIPAVISGVQREINFYVPESETQNDFSPFSDILDYAQSEEEDDQADDQKKEEEEEEDEHMVISSEDEEMTEGEEQEQEDDPMEVEEEEEQPEAKRRRIAKMIRSINSTAEKSNVCLACGSADHSIDQCSNSEARREVSEALDALLARFLEPSSSPKVRKTSKKGESKKRAPMGNTAEKTTVSYPLELSMLDRCADLQGGHWTICGTDSKIVGPRSHFEVVDNLIPEMEEDLEMEIREVWPK